MLTHTHTSAFQIMKDIGGVQCLGLFFFLYCFQTVSAGKCINPKLLQSDNTIPKLQLLKNRFTAGDGTLVVVDSITYAVRYTGGDNRCRWELDVKTESDPFAYSSDLLLLQTGRTPKGENVVSYQYMGPLVLQPGWSVGLKLTSVSCLSASFHLVGREFNPTAYNDGTECY